MMSPTAELRFINRVVPALEFRGHILKGSVRILQQKWVQHHIPADQNSAPFEWRDVPVVEENQK